MGIQVGALLGWARRAAVELRLRPFRCENLSWLNEASAQAEERLAPWARTPASGLTGLTLGLTALELDTLSRVEGVVVVGTERAEELLEGLRNWLPFLRGLQVPLEGPPVKLGPGPGPLAPLYAGGGDRGLGLAAGSAAATRLQEMLALPRKGTAFAHVGYDQPLLFAIRARIARLMAIGPPSAFEEAFDAYLRAAAHLHGRAEQAWRLTSSGLQIDVRQVPAAP